MKRAPAKRALDLILAAAGLVIGSPILLGAMLAIRLESPGHPIYRQRRIGRGGRPFDLYKLRTMVHGAEHMGAGMAVNEGDSRITRVGGFLRRTSLDELPNLVNVLRGEMSIVGPRPTIPVQVEQYTERQRGRLAVKPGITGWAQVNHPYGASVEDARAKLAYDLHYVQHRGLRLDLRILLATVRVVLFQEGAR